MGGTGLNADEAAVRMQGYFPCTNRPKQAEFATDHLVPPQFPMKGQLTSQNSLELFAHRQPKWHNDPVDTINERLPRARKSRRGCIRQQPSWWYGLHPNTHDEFTPAADAAKARPTRLQEGGDVTKSLLTPPWSKSDTFGERPIVHALPDKMQLPVCYDWNEENRLAVARNHRLKSVPRSASAASAEARQRVSCAASSARQWTSEPGELGWLNGFQRWE